MRMQCVSAVALVFVAYEVSAQTAPEYVFQVHVGTGCAGADVSGNIYNASSWNCTTPVSGARYAGSSTLSGSTSANSVTVAVAASIGIPGTAAAAQVRTGSAFSIYVKTPGVYTLSASNDVQLAIRATEGSKREFATVSGIPFTQSLSLHISAYPSGSATLSDQSAPQKIANCSGPSYTLPRWPGVKYCKLDSFSGPDATANAADTGPNTVSASGSTTIKIQPTSFIPSTQEAGAGLQTGLVITAACTKRSAAAVRPKSGNAMAVRRDPVRTRGYPLGTNIYINSQSKFPTLITPFGLNASFTYGIAIRTGSDGIRYLIGEDGSEYSYGPASGSPRAQAGVYGQLAPAAGGWRLTAAGPPPEIFRAGNFQYHFDSSGKLIRIIDPSGNVQQVTYSGSNPVQVTDLSTGKMVRFEYDTPRLVARIIENAGGP